MDLINDLLNIVAPPFIFLSLCLLVPLFQLPKFLLSVLRPFFSEEDVAGKVVIITGASSGIGEQLAYEYARRRGCLVLADIRGELLGKVANTCLEIGSPDVVKVTADVTDVNDCKRIVDSAISHFGRLDHLVNNAGIVTVSKFENYEDITKTRCILDVNFWGSVYITHFAIPHLRKTRGKMIVTASSASWVPMPKLSIYNASKAALVSFYETLRVEVGSEIHITIVTPGFVESEMTRGKHLAANGQMTVDPNDLSRVFPPSKTDRCAKAIVKSACRGDRRLVFPAWYRITHWLGTFFPELLEMILKLLYFPKRERGGSSLSNMIVKPPPEIKAE